MVNKYRQKAKDLYSEKFFFLVKLASRLNSGLKKEDELLNTLLASFNSRQLLKLLLQKLASEKDFLLEDLIKLFQEAHAEKNIPLSIFSHQLYPVEALSKYLHENENLSYQEIGQLINGDGKSVWASYQRAHKKMKQKFFISSQAQSSEKYFLPISLFANPSLSFLESTIAHLHSVYHLKNPQIAKLLHKSPNSIAVLAKRAKEKET